VRHWRTQKSPIYMFHSYTNWECGFAYTSYFHKFWWERNSRSFESKEMNLLEQKGHCSAVLWSSPPALASRLSFLTLIFLDFCIA
jgi:hypothetical protein